MKSTVRSYFPPGTRPIHRELLAALRLVVSTPRLPVNFSSPPLSPPAKGAPGRSREVNTSQSRVQGTAFHSWGQVRQRRNSSRVDRVSKETRQRSYLPVPRSCRWWRTRSLKSLPRERWTSGRRRRSWRQVRGGDELPLPVITFRLKADGRV